MWKQSKCLAILHFSYFSLITNNKKWSLQKEAKVGCLAINKAVWMVFQNKILMQELSQIVNFVKIYLTPKTKENKFQKVDTKCKRTMIAVKLSSV